MIERFLNWLTYTSPVLTERFQRLHLLVNYSILALTLVLYTLGVVGTWGIMLGCAPGAIIFIASLEALAWRMVNDDESPINLFLSTMQR